MKDEGFVKTGKSKKALGTFHYNDYKNFQLAAMRTNRLLFKWKSIDSV